MDFPREQWFNCVLGSHFLPTPAFSTPFRGHPFQPLPPQELPPLLGDPIPSPPPQLQDDPFSGALSWDLIARSLSVRSAIHQSIVMSSRLRRFWGSWGTALERSRPQISPLYSSTLHSFYSSFHSLCTFSLQSLYSFP